jgi:hypothetical protein
MEPMPKGLWDQRRRTVNTTTRSLLVRAAGAISVTLAFAIAIGSADSPLLTRDNHETQKVAASTNVTPQHHDDQGTAGEPLEQHESLHGYAVHSYITTLHNDHFALVAMHVYAAVHLGHFDVLPETFGGTPHWSPDWDLHWIDAKHDDHLVRIYHAIHKHQPHIQYTLMYDHDTAHSAEWEPAY